MTTCKISCKNRCRFLLMLAILVLLSACGQMGVEALPTSVSAAPTVDRDGEPVADAQVPPTWTVAPMSPTATSQTSLPTFTPRPTRTPALFTTNTPVPSPTTEVTATPTAVTETPTAVLTEMPTPLPTFTPAPSQGANLLPNPSFEGGWYHIGGLPELQVPEQWQLQWESGHNSLDHEPAPWVRPECRVLPPDFLPAEEHDTFIWDGKQTVKIFKGTGAVSFQLTTQVPLQPGTYRLEINVFPDLVVEYDENGKVWAPDPLSGEVRLIAGDQGTGWMLPTFGQKNTFTHVFSIDSPQTMQIGAAMRGRWAIMNNGWFMDDWGLFRVE